MREPGCEPGCGLGGVQGARAASPARDLRKHEQWILFMLIKPSAECRGSGMLCAGHGPAPLLIALLHQAFDSLITMALHPVASLI